MREHKKTILEKSNSCRKKRYTWKSPFSSMFLWGYLWKTNEPTIIYSDRVEIIRIWFVSRKYKHVNYWCKLRTPYNAAVTNLLDILYDTAAQLLGYANYDEIIKKKELLWKSQKKILRTMGRFDAKTGTYDLSIYDKKTGKCIGTLAKREADIGTYKGMCFHEVIYAEVWPKIRPYLETLLPPIYSVMTARPQSDCISMSYILDAEKLTILTIDDFVNDFLDGGERIIRHRCEETLCRPDLERLRADFDERAKELLEG